MRGRDDAVVHGLALRHVLEILLLQPQRGILVQSEVDGLAVIFLHQLLETGQRLGEGMVVVELYGAVQRNRCLRPKDRCHSSLTYGSRRRKSCEYVLAVHGPSSCVAQPLSRRSFVIVSLSPTVLWAR